jgi:hypothetical protein
MNNFRSLYTILSGIMQIVHVMNMPMHSSTLSALFCTYEASETLSKCPIYLNFSQSIKLKKIIIAIVIATFIHSAHFRLILSLTFLATLSSYIFAK